MVIILPKPEKTEKEELLINGYKLIILINIMGEIIDKIIYNRIVTAAEKYGLFFNN